MFRPQPITQRLFALNLAIAILSGCGGGAASGPKIETFPVKGTVVGTDGKPIGGGRILLRSVPGGEYAPSGEVDNEGEFTLATVINEKKVTGAPAGEYSVMIVPPSTSQAVLPVDLKKHYKIDATQSDLKIAME